MEKPVVPTESPYLSKATKELGAFGTLLAKLTERRDARPFSKPMSELWKPGQSLPAHAAAGASDLCQ
jgi:hypothetical protein